ncbi:hypothetical protein C0Q70_15021 [Pomacea canaliculata]|uniref:MARVEL domain-containing protein n=1 Tax=Pomacea canaliculata TaxID=400727 RepID=A0A2T7NTM7_POMCA|nr:hypothetical protein C0Q70_15021 [Pomacea canaliculata]
MGRWIGFRCCHFAFATTTSFSSSTTFRVKCVNATEESVTFSYGYPMDLESVCIKLPVCPGASTTPGLDKFCLLAGAKPAAEFYVFVGVIVMLYSLAALVIYIFFDELYRKNNRLIIVDFVVSVVLALLWLNLLFSLGFRFPECSVKDSCSTENVGNYGSLNASIIFGFLNMMVWLGNLWFLYKETPWFKIQSKPPSAPGMQSDLDPQKV